MRPPFSLDEASFLKDLNITPETLPFNIEQLLKDLVLDQDQLEQESNDFVSLKHGTKLPTLLDSTPEEFLGSRITPEDTQKLCELVQNKLLAKVRKHLNSLPPGAICYVPINYLGTNKPLPRNLFVYKTAQGELRWVVRLGTQTTGNKLIDKEKLLLGKGGFRSVEYGFDLFSNDIFALTINDDTNSDELTILNTVSNPYLIKPQAGGVFTDEDQCDKTILITPCHKHGVLESLSKTSMYEQVRIALQLLIGLKSLHDANLCHNDLKARNALVKNDMSACWIDLDGAKKEGLAWEQFTPAYASPEMYTQMRSRNYITLGDQAASAFGVNFDTSFANSHKANDMWALGVIIYQLIHHNNFPDLKFIRQSENSVDQLNLLDRIAFYLLRPYRNDRFTVDQALEFAFIQIALQSYQQLSKTSNKGNSVFNFFLQTKSTNDILSEWENANSLYELLNLVFPGYQDLFLLLSRQLQKQIFDGIKSKINDFANSNKLAKQVTLFKKSTVKLTEFSDQDLQQPLMITYILRHTSESGILFAVQSLLFNQDLKRLKACILGFTEYMRYLNSTQEHDLVTKNVKQKIDLTSLLARQYNAQKFGIYGLLLNLATQFPQCFSINTNQLLMHLKCAIKAKNYEQVRDIIANVSLPKILEHLQQGIQNNNNASEMADLAIDLMLLNKSQVMIEHDNRSGTTMKKTLRKSYTKTTYSNEKMLRLFDQKVLSSEYIGKFSDFFINCGQESPRAAIKLLEAMGSKYLQENAVDETVINKYIFATEAQKYIVIAIQYCMDNQSIDFFQAVLSALTKEHEQIYARRHSWYDSAVSLGGLLGLNATNTAKTHIRYLQEKALNKMKHEASQSQDPNQKQKILNKYYRSKLANFYSGTNFGSFFQQVINTETNIQKDIIKENNGRIPRL